MRKKENFLRGICDYRHNEPCTNCAKCPDHPNTTYVEDTEGMCIGNSNKVCDYCNACFTYGADVAPGSGPNWEGD